MIVTQYVYVCLVIIAQRCIHMGSRQPPRGCKGHALWTEPVSDQGCDPGRMQSVVTRKSKLFAGY